MHILDFAYNNSLNNCSVLQVIDLSQWDSTVGISNVTMKIDVPGMDCPFYLPYGINSTTSYTSNDFGLTSANCGEELSNLPDGLYSLTLSVCPNETIYKQKCIFRTCQTRCNILTKLGAILQGGCENKIITVNGQDQTVQKIQLLKDLLILLECAEADVQVLKYSSAEDKLNFVSKVLANY